MLLFSENNGMLLCPDCKIELDPNVHKFCYGCAKTIQEISNIRKKQGKSFKILFSESKIARDQ